MDLVIAIVLLLCAAAAIWMEIWLPSFGILTIISIALFAGAVYIGGQADAAGTILLIGLMLIPASIILAYKLIPYSPLTHRQSNPGTAADAPDIKELPALLNSTGTAVTDLRPSGTILVGDRKLDAVTLTGYVEKGKTVKIIKVEGVVLTVREEKETQDDA